MKKTLLSLNPLRYTGIVSLSQYTDSEKILLSQLHNKGTNQLFDYFANCLVGNFEAAKTNSPTKIMLLKKSSDGKTIEPASPFIYLRTLPEKIKEDASHIHPAVRYSFVISQDVVINKNFNAIGLFLNKSNDIKDYAACIDLEDINNEEITLIKLFQECLRGWTWDAWEVASADDKETIVKYALSKLENLLQKNLISEAQVYSTFWEWVCILTKADFEQETKEAAIAQTSSQLTFREAINASTALTLVLDWELYISNIND